MNTADYRVHTTSQAASCSRLIRSLRIFSSYGIDRDAIIKVHFSERVNNLFSVKKNRFNKFHTKFEYNPDKMELLQQAGRSKNKDGIYERTALS